MRRDPVETHYFCDFISVLATSSTRTVVKQRAARKLASLRPERRFKVGQLLDSSLGTTRPTSRQYSRWRTHPGQRWGNWMKKVTRADASLRTTRTPLPSAKDRTNQPMRLCRSSFASTSARFELFRQLFPPIRPVRGAKDRRPRPSYLSVLSLMMMVKAPKNLTWSFGRSSMPWANCHPEGERWRRWRASWVRAMT